MRNITTILVILLSLSASAQQKKDTAFIPVYLFERTDTVQVPQLAYKGPFGLVKYSEPGYVIRKGWAFVTNGQWAEKSQRVVGALNKRKKPVKAL